jgi:hypothetical protein
MKVAVISQDGNGDFTPPHTGPWLQFFSAIQNRGHEIVSHFEEPNVVIFMNNHSKLLRDLIKEKSKKKFYLVLWEPLTTHPANFNKNDRLHYSKIFSPSPEWINEKNSLVFNWPQCEPRMKELDKEEWHKRISEPSIFQANKYSLIKGENYSRRRRFLQKHNEEIHIYGQDWNAPIRSTVNLTKGLIRATKHLQFGLNLNQAPICIKLRNYYGYAVDKDSELSKYKFTVVIENSSDYVSEKIFEAIRNGCVVFYDGPNLDNYGIPNNIVISCPNITEKFGKAYASLLREKEMGFEIAQSAVEFHNSSEFKKLLNTNALRDLGDLICDSLEEDSYD